MKILIFTLTFLAFNCAQTTLKDYSSNKGYTFSFDDLEWVINENPNQTLLFVKSNTEENSSFKTNINIIVQDLSNKPLTLNEYHNITLNQIEGAIGKSSIKSQKDIKLPNNEAKEIIYVIPKDISNQRFDTLKLKQYYFIKNKKAYLITYTSKVDEYEKLEASFDNICHSFKVN